MTWEPLLEFIRAGEDDDRFNIGGREVDGGDGGASNSDAMTGAGEEPERRTGVGVVYWRRLTPESVEN